MADVRRFDLNQKRDPDGTWGDGIPGPAIPDLDMGDFSLINEIDGTFGKLAMGVDEHGDVRFAFHEYTGGKLHARELDLGSDELAELGDALDELAIERDQLADDLDPSGVHDDRWFGGQQEHKVELQGNGMIVVTFGAEDPDPWTLRLDPPHEADPADPSDEDYDDTQLLVDAIDEVLRETDTGRSARRARHSMRAWSATDEMKHPRGTGGRFRSNVDKLKHAIEVHRTSKSQGDPFAGFDREQLRRVAKARGIALSRGEDRDSIAKKLLDDLDGGAPKAAPEAAAPIPKPAPKPRKPRAVKAAPPKPEPKAAATKAKGRYVGPMYKYASPEAERLSGEMSDLRAKQVIGTITPSELSRLWDLDDLDVLDDVARRRTDQEAYIKANFERFRQAKFADRPAGDLQADMQHRSEQAWAGKPIAVRVTPGSLQGILEAGRFKTQFETNTSSALLDVDRRADVEARWFGIPRVGGDPKTRPIYGYVAVEGVRPSADFEHLNQYGNVQVLLKDGVRDRTTAMWGDSLNQDQFGWPEPVGSPTWKSYTTPPNSIATGELQELDRDANSKRWLDTNFVEAQIHGGVTVSDIAEIVLGEQPKPALRQALEAAGIPWRVL